MEIFGVKVEAIIRLIREVVITIFIGLLIYKVIDMDIAFDFTKLSATDLVALILAIFSVGLSAAFYFAATNSSSKFYDNMHKFTNETSVILGKLTERLNSVDKGQNEVKNRFDKLYNNGSTVASDAEDKEKEEEKEKLVSQSREDLKDTIESLFDKHQVSSKERNAFKAQLEKKELQLSESLSQLSEFKSKQKSTILSRVKMHSRRRIRRELERENFSFDSIIEKIFNITSRDSKYRDDLVDLGFIDNSGASTVKDLTDTGFKFFGDIYEGYQEDAN